MCVGVCERQCVSDKERASWRGLEGERAREVQSLVFPWVYCSNIVILINIYLPGKVQRMISSRVGVRESMCVCTAFSSEQPLVHVCSISQHTAHELGQPLYLQ